MSDSIFTKIINHEIPGEIIYEDDHVAAFFTIEPVHLGHTLVVPKVPFVNIFDGDPEVLAHMMRIAQRVANVITETTGVTGVNLQMNNGADAGQEVFHAHLHVYPRQANDQAVRVSTTENDPEQAAALATTMRDRLS